MSPNLENAYFLDGAAPRRHDERSTNHRESRRGAKRATDAVGGVVVGGINVVPNHHHTHRVPGGSHPIRYRFDTVPVASEVATHA